MVLTLAGFQRPRYFCKAKKFFASRNYFSLFMLLLIMCKDTQTQTIHRLSYLMVAFLIAYLFYPL